MQSLVGHAVDVARAALGNEPPHDGVHTRLPVGAPHASTGLTFDLSEVTDTDCMTRSSVQIPTDLQTGVIRLRPAVLILTVRERQQQQPDVYHHYIGLRANLEDDDVIVAEGAELGAPVGIIPDDLVDEILEVQRQLLDTHTLTETHTRVQTA